MRDNHDDFEFEPVYGLPEALPFGELMLWQGAPRWQDLAVQAFHTRKVIWYFAGVALVQGAVRFAEGESLSMAIAPIPWLLIFGLTTASILCGLAFLCSRTTVYTITTKRVIMRVGMAIPVSINLPFSQIDGAALKLFGRNSGDISLELSKKERVAYLMLWPHARPFHYRNPQPCLRCVPDAKRVADLLSASLAGTVDMPISGDSLSPQVPLNIRPVAA